MREITETMDVTQAKLAMGYRAASEDTPALLLANLIFGGYSNSKLFLNVREKLSLCYYASSGYHRSKGIITVSSGIEAQNYEVARREIAAQLEAVTPERVAEAARSIRLDTVYFLTGKEGAAQ